MIAAFSWCLVSLVLPPLALTVLDPDWRRRFFAIFPVLLALYLGCAGLVAVAAHRFIDFGLLRYLLVISAGALMASMTMRRLGHRLKLRLPPASLYLVALVAVLASLDIAIILTRNGWSLEPGLTYFRPPLHSDNQRNLVVIEALARGEGSPYLAGAGFAYQLFWHHLFGTLLFPFEGVTRFAVVSGATAATAVTAFFLMTWALVALKPTLLRGPWPAVAIACLAFSHADVYYWVVSILTEGQPAIEADWSITHGFFRSFSLKLAALTSPQHALFLAMLATTIVLRRRRARALAGVLAVLGFVASPVLAVMGLFLVLVEEMVRLRRFGMLFMEGTAIALGGLALYTLVFGESPLSVVIRPGVSELGYVTRDLKAWLSLPLVLVGSLGVLGAFLSVRLRRLGTLAVPLVAGALLFGYCLDEPEVRRHFAVIASLLGALALVKALPRPTDSRAGTGLAIAALGAFFLNGYFLYCYTLKPSKLDAHIPWTDYFQMNEIVRREFPGEPVLAAAEPWTLGLEMPVVMEAATSFSLPAHAAIHSRLTPRQHEILLYAWRGRNILPYAERLGYQLILWGPVEEKAWGERMRDRFVGPQAPIATAGKVGLYLINDQLRRRFDRLVAAEGRAGSTP